MLPEATADEAKLTDPIERIDLHGEPGERPPVDAVRDLHLHDGSAQQPGIEAEPVAKEQGMCRPENAVVRCAAEMGDAPDALVFNCSATA